MHEPLRFRIIRVLGCRQGLLGRLSGTGVIAQQAIRAAEAKIIAARQGRVLPTRYGFLLLLPAASTSGKRLEKRPGLRQPQYQFQALRVLIDGWPTVE